jgi:myosin-1
MYDFAGQTSGELSLRKDEVVIVEKKEDNGKLQHSSSSSITK